MQRSSHPRRRAAAVAVLAALLALAGASAARAATIPPAFVAAASWVAGHPVAIVCDPDLGGHAAEYPGALGWTAYGGSTIYVILSICANATARPRSATFADAIGAVIHEAAHARGIRSESCAEMTADIGVYDVLRRFFGVPFFSSDSEVIGALVLAETRQLPAAYQPEACWRSGIYR